jgi:hypothetical protein
VEDDALTLWPEKAVELLDRNNAMIAYESVDEARRQLTSYFTFYNSVRPHSSLKKPENLSQ